MKLIFIFILSTTLAYSFEEGFDDVKLLTDQEQVEANEYYHAGLAEERRNEACANNDLAEDLCTNSNNAFNSKGMQTLEAMIPMVTKAYSMILGNTSFTMGTGEMITNGTGDKALSYTKNESGDWVNKQVTTDPKTGAQSVTTSEPISDAKMKEMKDSGAVKEKTEKKKDWCAMIPMASEMASQAFMLVSNDNIEQQFQASEPGYEQKASLYAIKESQMAQKKASIAATAGWGATSVCYIGYAIAGADLIVYAKMAASVLITTFYGFKIAAHQARADAVQEILDGFPEQGECNPHTQTTCFCSTSSSMQVDPGNFQKVCVPPPFANRFNQDPFACVNASGQSDPECLCAQTNTCVDATLKSGFAKLGLNPNSLAGPLEALRPITRGTGAGALGDAHQRNLAMARKALKKFRPKKLPSFKLSPKQKKLASDMTKLGVPPAAAAMIAGQPVTASPAGANLAGLSGNGKFGSGKIKGKGSRKSAMRFKGSGGGGSGRFKTSSRDRSRFGNKGSSSGGGGVVMLDDLQRKAASNADIHKSPGKNIFDIITYRYNVSAWKRFEDTINKELKSNKPTTQDEK